MNRLLRPFRAYPTLFKASFAVALEYRVVTAIWVLTGVLPLLMMMVWISVAEGAPSGEVNGFDRLDFIGYFLAVTLIRRMVGVWLIWDLDEDIRLGKLSFHLLKPIHPAHHYLTSLLGDKPFELLWVAPPVILALVLLGVRYTLAWYTIPLILLAVVGAILIDFFMQMSIGALGFWLTQVVSFAQIWFLLRSFFSGWVVPLAMFPAVLQNLLVYLPFRYLLSFPIEILLGDLSRGEIALGFAMQAAWIGLVFAIYRLLWQHGLKRFTAVGA